MKSSVNIARAKIVKADTFYFNLSGILVWQVACHVARFYSSLLRHFEHEVICKRYIWKQICVLLLLLTFEKLIICKIFTFIAYGLRKIKTWTRAFSHTCCELCTTRKKCFGDRYLQTLKIVSWKWAWNCSGCVPRGAFF